MAVPPFAVTPMLVRLATSPPSAATGPPQVSPIPMALPALPPLLTSPIWTAPPLADDVATPPLPADAVSVNCMMISPLLCPPPWGELPRISYGVRRLEPIARKSRMSPKRDRASGCGHLGHARMPLRGSLGDMAERCPASGGRSRVLLESDPTPAPWRSAL